VSKAKKDRPPKITDGDQFREKRGTTWAKEGGGEKGRASWRRKSITRHIQCPEMSWETLRRPKKEVTPGEGRGDPGRGFGKNPWSQRGKRSRCRALGQHASRGEGELTKGGEGKKQLRGIRGEKGGAIVRETRGCLGGLDRLVKRGEGEFKLEKGKNKALGERRKTSPGRCWNSLNGKKSATAEKGSSN